MLSDQSLSAFMSVPFALLLSATAAFAQESSSASAQGGKQLTLSQAYGTLPSHKRVSFSVPAPRWRWAPDGKHLISGRGDKEQWFDPATMKAVEPVKQADASRAEQKEQASADAAKKKSLAQAPKGSELRALSADGKWLSWVQDNDLHVMQLSTGRSKGLTSDGGADMFNGKLDWVYQEELYGRGDFQANWWGPNSRYIAFLRLDEAPVHEFTVIDHIEEGHFRVKAEISNYPKAGDPNPIVMLGVAEVATGGVAWIDLSTYAGTEPLVVRVGWTPTGQLLFMVQDRIQTWLDLCVADPDGGKPTVLIHEESKAWVNRLPMPHWLKDGSFLWESERTGYNHVYHYTAEGKLRGPLTGGDWALRSIEQLDEEGGKLLFTGTKDGAINRNLYSIDLDGHGLTRLTQGNGRHSWSFNGDGSLFIDTFSSLEAPPEVQLCNASGQVLRSLAKAQLPDSYTEYATSRWQSHVVRARDGFELDVALLPPLGIEAGKTYAVWLPTYSGPDAATVRNSWNGSAWFQLLAQQGIGVLQVNVRSASGKGQWSTELAYKQMGAVELQDLVDAVAWVCEKPWADSARVGITGYSYGGFMSAYALLNSKSFALGFAGGGVYDWAMYDSIYTERYMSTPQLNPAGYAKTSCLNAVSNLHGHLVIHHGVMDDNVHVQNAMQFIYALQKANKKFDFMLYPQNRHGVRDPDQRWHSRQMEWDAIREHLGGPRPRASAPAGPR